MLDSQFVKRGVSLPEGLAFKSNLRERSVYLKSSIDRSAGVLVLYRVREVQGRDRLGADPLSKAG